MTHPGGQGEFDDFDDQWKSAEKASLPGRVPPGTYKVMCTAVDNGEGVMVDHDVIDNTENGGSKGLKIFFEILDPEKIGNQVVRGEQIEKVFWVTGKTIPYVKRDVATIIGRDLESIRELPTIQWAGKTCEVVCREEEYNGFINTRVSFINPWHPDKNKATAEKAKKINKEKITAPEKEREDVAF